MRATSWWHCSSTGPCPRKPFRLEAAELVALATALVKGGLKVHVCQEAGPCGFGMHRQLLAAGAAQPGRCPHRAGRRPAAEDRRLGCHRAARQARPVSAWQHQGLYGDHLLRDDFAIVPWNIWCLPKGARCRPAGHLLPEGLSRFVLSPRAFPFTVLRRFRRGRGRWSRPHR